MLDLKTILSQICSPIRTIFLRQELLVLGIVIIGIGIGLIIAGSEQREASSKMKEVGSKIEEAGSALQQSGRIIAELDTAASARLKEAGSALQKVELSIAELDTAAVRLKEAGSALQKVELSIAELDTAAVARLKEAGSALQQSGRIIAELDTAAVARLKEAGAKIKKASQNLTKLWMWIGVVLVALVAIVGLWKPRIFLLLVLAIVIIIGLCIACLNIQNVFGLSGQLLLIGLVVTVGVGAVRFVGFKTWPGRKWSVRFRNGIVDLFAIILGQLVGVVIADILFFQDKEYMILWLAFVLLCAGVMITWYAVFKKQISGIVTIGVALIGILLPGVTGHNLTNVFINYNPLLQIYDSGIDSKLRELKTHTDILSRAMHDSLTKAEKRLEGQFQELSKNISDTIKFQTDSLTTILESQTESLTKAEKRLEGQFQELSKNISDTIKFQTDSLTTILESQTDSLTTVLESQTDTIDAIKDELDEAKKAQNSVRLLIGSEDSLTTEGFLNADRSFPRLWAKSYNLSKNLSDYGSLDTIAIGQSFTIAEARHKLIKGSGQLDLKRIVSHTGTLKEKEDYTVKIDSTTTSITFINPLLGGMHILAVVERRKN